MSGAERTRPPARGAWARHPSLPGRPPVIWKIARAFVLFLLVVSISFLIAEPTSGWPWYWGGIPPRGLVPIPGSDPCGLRATWATDQSVFVRYPVYVANILQGQWGVTFFSPSCGSALALILAHAPVTLGLTFGALLLCGLVGRVAGPAVARRQGRLLGTLGSAAALASTALPVAGAGALLIAATMLTTGGEPPIGIHSPSYASLTPVFQAMDYIGHLILPLFAVTACSMGFLVLASRNASLREQSRRGPRLVLDSLSGGPAAPGERGYAVPPVLPEIVPYVGWTVSAALLVDLLFRLDGLGPEISGYYLPEPFVSSGVFLLLSLVVIVTSTAVDLVSPPEHGLGLTSELAVPGDSRPLGRTLRGFVSRRGAIAGLALLVVLTGVTLAAPSLLGPYNPSYLPSQAYLPPSLDHPLGTDRLGVDLLAEVAAGGTIPLLAAAWGFGFALVAGIGVALSAGVVGGRADDVVSAVIQGLLCIPWLPFIGLLALAGRVPGFLFVGLLAWPITARNLRTDVVEHMRYRGFPDVRPLLRRSVAEGGSHQVWNRSTARILGFLSPLIVSSALMAAALAVLIVAGTGLAVGESPFGVIIQAGSWPSWEALMAGSYYAAASGPAWFAMLPPAMAFFAASVALAGLGFALREATLPLPWMKPTGRAAPQPEALFSE